MNLLEAVQLKQSNILESITGYTNADINETFEQWKDRFNYSRLVDGIPSQIDKYTDVELQEIYNSNKYYFDGDKKQIGDKCVMIGLWTTTTTLELVLIPERRIPYYNDICIIDEHRLSLESSIICIALNDNKEVYDMIVHLNEEYNNKVNNHE